MNGPVSFVRPAKRNPPGPAHTTSGYIISNKATAESEDVDKS